MANGMIEYGGKKLESRIKNSYPDIYVYNKTERNIALNSISIRVAETIKYEFGDVSGKIGIANRVIRNELIGNKVLDNYVKISMFIAEMGITKLSLTSEFLKGKDMTNNLFMT